MAASGVTGGGARSVTSLSEEQFSVPYRDLDPARQAAIRTTQFHTRTWRNDTTVSVMAVFACGKLACKGSFEVDAKDLSSPVPCGPCILVHSSRAFEITLAKDWKAIAKDEAKTQKFTPGIFRNEMQGKIFAQRRGVEKLFEEVRNCYSHLLLKTDMSSAAYPRSLRSLCSCAMLAMFYRATSKIQRYLWAQLKL